MNEKAIRKVWEAINGDKDIRSNTPKNLEFIIDRDKTHLNPIIGSQDLGVHVEGKFEFNNDLALEVIGEGVIDYESSYHSPRIHKNDKIGHNYAFRKYEIKLKLRATNKDYIRALSKFGFDGNRFSNGELTMTQESGGRDMFSKIRLFKQVAAVEDFVKLGTEKELERTESNLRERVRELGLGNLQVEYENYCEGLHGFEFINFRYITIAEAKHKDSDVNIGFKIRFCPTGIWHEYNRELKTDYSWIVQIPADTKREIVELYNRKFKTIEIDPLDDTSLNLAIPNIAMAGKGVVNYSLENETEFLKCFSRWKNALHFLKYGKQKEITDQKLLTEGLFLE